VIIPQIIIFVNTFYKKCSFLNTNKNTPNTEVKNTKFGEKAEILEVFG